MRGLIPDLRRAALIAGIVTAISALWGSLVIVLTLVFDARSESSLLSTLAIVVPLFLLEAPFPVFFLVLYKSGVAFTVSAKLRRGVLGLAIIQVAHFFVSGVNDWSTAVHPRSYTGFAHWFNQSLTRVVTDDALALAPGLALALFLIALHRNDITAVGAAGMRQVGRVKNLAILAACACALTPIIAISGTLFSLHLMPERGTAESLTRIARTLLFSLPRIMTPLIIYASIPRGSTEVGPNTAIRVAQAD
jgi:hypothetical protein